ncbi:MAG: hypothetical protein VKJ09_15540, partial [Leptolyngbya sp.]|nr:hypothetical protein [Leptolyngbya sp.]
MAESPVFVHSLFRSGSTYIYNAFQKVETPASFFCFQEPLNELVVAMRDAPERLEKGQEGEGETQRKLRHPPMKRG